jgi:hypothetical protein
MTMWTSRTGEPHTLLWRGSADAIQAVLYRHRDASQVRERVIAGVERVFEVTECRSVGVAGGTTERLECHDEGKATLVSVNIDVRTGVAKYVGAVRLVEK